MGPGKTRPGLTGWGSGSEKTLENVTFERFSAAGRMGGRGLFSSKFGKSNLRSILELFGIGFGAFLVPLGALLGRSCGLFGALLRPFGGGGGGQKRQRIKWHKIVFYATCYSMVSVLFFCCLPLLLLALGALWTFLGVLLALLEGARRLIARGVLWALSCGSLGPP